MQYDLRLSPHHLRLGPISIRPVRIWSRPTRNSLRLGFDHSVITFDQSTTCLYLHTTSPQLVELSDLLMYSPFASRCLVELQVRCCVIHGLFNTFSIECWITSRGRTVRLLVAWPCTFFIRSQRGAHRHLSCYVRRGKSHIRPVTSLCMFHSIPESYLYNYPVTVQRLATPKSALTHVGNHADLRSKDYTSSLLETN